MSRIVCAPLNLNSKDEMAALKRISSWASSLTLEIDSIYKLPSSISPSLSKCSVPDLILPYPTDFLTPIMTLKVTENTRNILIRRLNRGINELQLQYQSSYRRTCVDNAQRQDPMALLKSFESLSQRHYLPIIKSWVSFIVSSITRHQERLGWKNKQPFNNECTPALEKYFELNGYPSVIHRSRLASATGMTPRQIEVWFQNHRNRAKKDGKTVRRITSELPMNIALNALPNGFVTKRHDYSSNEDDSGDDVSDREASQEQLRPNSCLEIDDPRIDPFRPPHAFPSKFTGTGLDPFATNNGSSRFPPPVWMRRPQPCSNKSTTPIDIDEFIILFQSKMTFLEKKRGMSLGMPSETSEPWYTSTVTILPRAHHPAFVKTMAPPVICRDFSTSRPQRFPAGPGRSGVTTAFLSPPHCNADKSRKFAPYSKRRPTTSKRNFSSSSSTEQPNRTFSSGSDMSSTTFFSSSSVESSPEPSTPPHLPLPELSDISSSDFNFETMEFDLSVLNHPDICDILDFDFATPTSLHMPMQDKYVNMTTLDPSLLTLSNPTNCFQ